MQINFFRMHDFLTYADVVRNNQLDDNNESVQGAPSERSGTSSTDGSIHDGTSDSGNGSTGDQVSAEALTEMIGRMDLDWRSYRTPLSVSPGDLGYLFNV